MEQKRLELDEKSILNPKIYNMFDEDTLFKKAKEFKKTTEFKKKYYAYKKEQFSSNNIIKINDQKLNGGEYKITVNDGVVSIVNYSNEVVTKTLIYPSKIFVELENETEVVEFTYKKRGEWYTIKVPRSYLSNSAKLAELSAYGISMDVYSKNLLSKYLTDMLDLNSYNIEVKNSLSRLRLVSKYFCALR